MEIGSGQELGSGTGVSPPTMLETNEMISIPGILSEIGANSRPVTDLSDVRLNIPMFVRDGILKRIRSRVRYFGDDRQTGPFYSFCFRLPLRYSIARHEGHGKREWIIATDVRYPKS